MSFFSEKRDKYFAFLPSPRKIRTFARCFHLNDLPNNRINLHRNNDICL